MSALPPLPWVVHAVSRNPLPPSDTCILVGVFDTRMDLLRAMTRWIFEGDEELLVTFCLGIAQGVEYLEAGEFDYVWHFFTQDCDNLPTDLITDSLHWDEFPHHPFFKVSSIRDERVDVLEDNNMLRARDLFADLPFTLTLEQFKAVAKWIKDGTLYRHLAILAWCGVVRNRDGFEGGVKARVASFLF